MYIIFLFVFYCYLNRGETDEYNCSSKFQSPKTSRSFYFYLELLDFDKKVELCLVTMSL
jgi:hypothetical protein